MRAMIAGAVLAALLAGCQSFSFQGDETSLDPLFTPYLTGQS